MIVEKVPAWKWSFCVGTNLLLGVPAIVPVWAVWYFAVNFPLAGLGWTQRNPTENDGILPAVLILVPVVTCSVLVWWLVNFAVVHWTHLPGKSYWLTSVLVVLMPAFACMAAAMLL